MVKRYPKRTHDDGLDSLRGFLVAFGIGLIIWVIVASAITIVRAAYAHGHTSDNSYEPAMRACASCPKE